LNIRNLYRRSQKITLHELPPNINKYVGRTNFHEYHRYKDAFSKTVGFEIASQKVERLKLDDVCIDIMFFFPDKRRRDTGNLEKCLLDALVNNEIITDDNWFVIKEKTEKGSYRKNDAGAEITIWFK